MAALSRPARVIVRAAQSGEGAAIAALWRELWDAHEAWGGYAGTRDPRVYAQLAQRIEEDARVRAGSPILGRHVHLVADLAGAPCGQVEGWFERHGVDATTPFTCEVRSLIVTERARGLGAGRLLLDELAAAALRLSGGAHCVLAAEVLEINPAQSFYARVGYRPVSYNARLDLSPAARAPAHLSPAAQATVTPAAAPGGFSARLALPRDALPIACLEGTLAARRRAAGDARFDRPRAVDATMVGAITAHLADRAAGSQDPATLVTVDERGIVRAAAAFTTHALEPPFIPVRRALLGRFAVDPACAPGPVLAPLVSLARRLAQGQGATRIELTDLAAPATPLFGAALACGAAAWSRVVLKPAAGEGPCQTAE
jgi:GNAT superfamily N-acetyltransferase